MSMIGPVQSRCHEGSPVGKRNLRCIGLLYICITHVMAACRYCIASEVMHIDFYYYAH